MRNIENEIELDTNLTPELKDEGVVREFTRANSKCKKRGKVNTTEFYKS